MAYVYRHIRLDKNEPFYIGIGIDKNRHSIKRGRNSIWKYIVNKTKYESEILFDNISWEEACKKEIEFIKLYGRINTNTGILANMTDGGDGTVGRKASVETNLKRSKSLKGKRLGTKTGKPAWNTGLKLSKEYREKLSKSHKGTPITFTDKRIEADAKKRKKVQQINITGDVIKEYASLRQAVRETGFDCGSLSKAANGVLKTSYGFIWKYIN